MKNLMAATLDKDLIPISRYREQYLARGHLAPSNIFYKEDLFFSAAILSLAFPTSPPTRETVVYLLFLFHASNPAYTDHV